MWFSPFLPYISFILKHKTTYTEHETKQNTNKKMYARIGYREIFFFCESKKKYKKLGMRNHKFANTNWKSFSCTFFNIFRCDSFSFLFGEQKNLLFITECMQDNVMISMTRRKLFDHVIDLGEKSFCNKLE